VHLQIPSWSLLLHMVPMPDGSWRPCNYYRRPNLATVHDRYPLPSLQDLSSKLHGCKFFSCHRLGKGLLLQVPMDEKKGLIQVRNEKKILRSYLNCCIIGKVKSKEALFYFEDGGRADFSKNIPHLSLK
jgi:hypothetical protein